MWGRRPHPLRGWGISYGVGAAHPRRGWGESLV